MKEPPERVVVDASVLVDLFAGTEVAPAVRARLAGTVLHAPAHLEAEVLSALGRLQRAGDIRAADVEVGLARLATLPLSRHDLSQLLAGAWARRAEHRLLDALYVELATRLGVRLVTTDHRLARVCPFADAITSST